MKIPERIMRKRSEALVLALIGKNQAPNWWSSTNKAFDGKTPEEHWKVNPEDVYNYLMYHVSK
jgi:ArsR family metal-binding transcriptional regulator